MFQRFSIDRRTAEKVGGPVGHLQDEPARILAKGDEDNSLVVFWVAHSYVGAGLLDVLRVDEFVPGVKKPFTALGGGTIYTGLCE